MGEGNGEEEEGLRARPGEVDAARDSWPGEAGAVLGSRAVLAEDTCVCRGRVGGMKSTADQSVRVGREMALRGNAGADEAVTKEGLVVRAGDVGAASLAFVEDTLVCRDRAGGTTCRSEEKQARSQAHQVAASRCAPVARAGVGL